MLHSILISIFTLPIRQGSLEKIREFEAQANVQLFGRPSVPYAFAYIDRTAYKIEKTKVEPIKVFQSGRTFTMNERGGIDVLKQSIVEDGQGSDRLDPHTMFSRVKPEYVNKIDEFLISQRGAMDMETGRVLDLKDLSFVATANRLNGSGFIAVLNQGSKYSIGRISKVGAKLNLEQIPMNGTSIETVLDIAEVSDGFLVSGISGLRNNVLYKFPRSGGGGRRIAMEPIQDIGLRDGEGLRCNCLVSFERGGRFLWATQTKLFLGKPD